MKNYGLTIILLVTLLFCSTSYAAGEKSIVIIAGLDLDIIELIADKVNIGIGYINLNIKKAMGDESYYLSLAAGEKTRVKSEDYKGLYKDDNGNIIIAGFGDIYNDVAKGGKSNRANLIGQELKEEGIAYIGNSSQAIMAADRNGVINSGEIEVVYNKEWLLDKTNLHLTKSNMLILSYDINDSYRRTMLLRDYIKEYDDYNILIIPSEVPESMKHAINNGIAPIIYARGGKSGILKSISTRREGFITIEDVYAELISLYGRENPYIRGNRINIVRRQDNLSNVNNLFKRTINLMWITYVFHGLVYFIQCFSVYFIYRRKEKIDTVNIVNSFVIINIFIGLLMGISTLHINIALYLFINIIASYVITLFMADREIDVIGLFAVLTYIIIVIGIAFLPDMIYNSFIGFNNLFYGARYYGLNNGIMGVLLVSSVISCSFVKDLIKNETIRDLVCPGFAIINIIMLSTRYGANTGGFMTATFLFLSIVYMNLLNIKWKIHNIIALLLLGIIILVINLYSDYLGYERSHAVNTLIRLRAFGFSEVMDILKRKAMESIRLTLMPPFSIVIFAQIICIRKLLRHIHKGFKKETIIIILTGIVGFLLNDTGIITIIYVYFYLIAFIAYNKKSSYIID